MNSVKHEGATWRMTAFNGEGTGKIPYSPYGDKTFIFETAEVSDNVSLYRIMVKNYILNIPLVLPEPVRSYRRKVDLAPYFPERLRYVVLDIDQVTRRSDMLDIVGFFRDYRVILGESRSHNGIDNFNMKGVLFVDIAIGDATKVLVELNRVINADNKLCVIDVAAGRRTSLNAPIGKYDIVYNKEDGPEYVFRSVSTDMSDVVKRGYMTNPGVKHRDILSMTDGKDYRTVDQFCVDVFAGMGFSAVKSRDNGSVQFRHTAETKTPGGYFWFRNSPYTMHHPDSSKTVDIFNVVRKNPKAKDLMVQALDYGSMLEHFNCSTNVVRVNERYLSVSSEVQSAIDSFILEPGGLFTIRSPMGTGKSTVIAKIITDSHDNDLRVLVVTNRVSVAEDFGRKYSMKVYNADEYVTGDSLICQFDSLCKYNVQLFDVVIMDEFVSLLLHTRSNLSNSDMNVSRFFSVFDKKLVIADAFLTGYENFLLSGCTNVHMLMNEYRDNTALLDYTCPNNFTKELLRCAKQHKCTVSSTSLRFVKSLAALLKHHGLRVVQLTAETPASTKELLYELFEQPEQDRYDVLIFSPTLTVGVSNINNIRHHWHYDGSISADVVSSVQMMKRTRRAGHIHMYVKPRINYLRTEPDEIRDDFMSNIGLHSGQNYLYELTDYGETRLSGLGKIAVQLDTFRNILELDHRGGLLWMLRFHFASDARTIDDKFTGNILSKYVRAERAAAKSQALEAVDEYMMLNELDRDHALNDRTAEKSVRAIALIHDRTNRLSGDALGKFLECCTLDPAFADKCEMYRTALRFFTGLWNEDDVKYRVQRAVKNNPGMVKPLNAMLNLGQTDIHDRYSIRVINSTRGLKTVLDACGYALETKHTSKTPGYRAYVVNTHVKKLHGYIR